MFKKRKQKMIEEIMGVMKKEMMESLNEVVSVVVESKFKKQEVEEEMSAEDETKIHILRNDATLYEFKQENGISVFMPISEKVRIDKMWEEREREQAEDE